MRKIVSFNSRKPFIKAGLLFLMAISCVYLQPVTAKNNKTNSCKLNSEEEELILYMEQPPKFPGGEEALIMFVQKNVHHPKSDSIEKTAGTVIVRFIVDKTGKATKAEILRSLNPGYDKEALQIIDLMPQWEPGKQNGINISAYYTLPVHFTANTPLAPKMVSCLNDIVEHPENPPSYPGGERAMLQFIHKNLTVPLYRESEQLMSGRIIVRFAVDTKGSILNIEVLRTFDKRLNQAVIDVIHKMPQWIPATHKGKNVTAFYTLPVSINVQ